MGKGLYRETITRGKDDMGEKTIWRGDSMGRKLHGEVTTRGGETSWGGD